MHLYARLRAFQFVTRMFTIIELQLVITALSLPVMLVWGLPFSLLTMAGNVLFTPFLFGYLLLSSLIFITQLLAVPNTVLITLLGYLQHVWLRIMAHVDSRVMLELPSPGLGGAALLFVLALGLILLRIKNMRVRCALLFSFLVISCTGLHFFARPSHAHLTFKHGAGTLHAFAINGELSIVDDGIRSRSGLKSFITYTVVPTVRAQCGTTRITVLVFLKPTAASPAIARLLLDSSNTRPHDCTIILPARVNPAKPGPKPTGTETKTEQAAEQLESWAHSSFPNNIRLLTTDSRPFISKNHTLEIKANGILNRTKNYAHALLCVHAHYGQETIMLKPYNKKLTG